jgi:hypothetical protein
LVLLIAILLESDVLKMPCSPPYPRDSFREAVLRRRNILDITKWFVVSAELETMSSDHGEHPAVDETPLPR